MPQINKVFITGINGFVGSHLADYILAEHPEVEIIGLMPWHSPKDNIRHILDKVTLCYGDMLDFPSLEVGIMGFLIVRMWKFSLRPMQSELLWHLHPFLDLRMLRWGGLLKNILFRAKLNRESN